MLFELRYLHSTDVSGTTHYVALYIADSLCVFSLLFKRLVHFLRIFNARRYCLHWLLNLYAFTIFYSKIIFSIPNHKITGVNRMRISLVVSLLFVVGLGTEPKTQTQLSSQMALQTQVMRDASSLFMEMRTFIESTKNSLRGKQFQGPRLALTASMEAMVQGESLMNRFKDLEPDDLFWTSFDEIVGMSETLADTCGSFEYSSQLIAQVISQFFPQDHELTVKAVNFITKWKHIHVRATVVTKKWERDQIALSQALYDYQTLGSEEEDEQYEELVSTSTSSPEEFIIGEEVSSTSSTSTSSTTSATTSTSTTTTTPTTTTSSTTTTTSTTTTSSTTTTTSTTTASSTTTTSTTTASSTTTTSTTTSTTSTTRMTRKPKATKIRRGPTATTSSTSTTTTSVISSLTFQPSEPIFRGKENEQRSNAAEADHPQQILNIIKREVSGEWIPAKSKKKHRQLMNARSTTSTTIAPEEVTDSTTINPERPMMRRISKKDLFCRPATTSICVPSEPSTTTVVYADLTSSTTDMAAKSEETTSTTVSTLEFRVTEGPSEIAQTSTSTEVTGPIQSESKTSDLTTSAISDDSVHQSSESQLVQADSPHISRPVTFVPQPIFFTACRIQYLTSQIGAMTAELSTLVQHGLAQSADPVSGFNMGVFSQYLANAQPGIEQMQMAGDGLKSVMHGLPLLPLYCPPVMGTTPAPGNGP
jgi:hypothetical protein